ncbi:MAG: hypothetical protein ACYSVY_17335 [Planctomycetota bacterium]
MNCQTTTTWALVFAVLGFGIQNLVIGAVEPPNPTHTETVTDCGANPHEGCHIIELIYEGDKLVRIRSWIYTCDEQGANCEFEENTPTGSATETSMPAESHEAQLGIGIFSESSPVGSELLECIRACAGEVACVLWCIEQAPGNEQIYAAVGSQTSDHVSGDDLPPELDGATVLVTDLPLLRHAEEQESKTETTATSGPTDDDVYIVFVIVVDWNGDGIIDFFIVVYSDGTCQVIPAHNEQVTPT